jgi:hypothetical protein
MYGTEGRESLADDLVIVAKWKRNERNDEEPGKVYEEKKLEVNVEKTKMMVFNKRKRESEENE